MSGDRWHQLQDIFWQARSLPAAEREAYLQDAAGDDVALIEQVRRMLVAEQTTGILDVPSDLFTPLDQLMDDVPGERVGPYQLAGEIGRGGMGVVYRAYDRRLHRDVALKFLSTPIRDAAAEERFIKEARAASVLDHPHNCPVYDIGKTEKGRLYIAMAYCSGGSLAQRIAAGPLPIAEAVRIAYEVADLLQAAHQAGIIHRDIKPANIAFSDRGDARVLDFGVAVFGHADVQASTPAGTIAYMSPEQLNGAAADSRSDIWALGVVLYEMLTGQRPFTGERDQIRHAILNEDPADVRSLRPDVHPALARVVARALQKNPAQRFAGAREFKDALPAAEYARTPFGGMRKWIAAAALVAAIATSGYFAIRQRGAAPILSENNTVVVLPFRVSSEPALAYLREGMMDLLAAKLTGEGGLRAADPRTVIASGPPELIERDVTRNQALALARKLGAANVLLGNVVGNANNLVVNATLLDASGRVISTTTVEGAHDNLSPLVDQMVAELLTTSSGEDRHRLASLTSTSLPALRAYLEGQAAYRRGRFREALEKFTEAIDIDSTFALAGLSLDLADGWVGAGTGDRGLRVAWLSRDRLSERDRAFLETAVGTAYPRLPTVTERLEATERALRLSPDRAELWYTLGDLHLHWGASSAVMTGKRAQSVPSVVRSNSIRRSRRPRNICSCCSRGRAACAMQKRLPE